ncbi:putative serine protein kinase PrkA [Geothermobacter ehrlichii]|uniref:Putative serine protein kinase PrkA n=1 Tax=Geothermobacter ehrlichii TaxID=213224 RepID=A0A5D3WGZ5_9BACT|nr:serine protein kinase PrkA [Geothermobacter ehrlichii]TYO98096.1 putative serine protein kinase PrkA [Geothermobacter ehrlichii]
MKKIDQALTNIDRSLRRQKKPQTIRFEQYLEHLSRNPALVLRNVFQVFSDLIQTCIEAGTDEYEGDPESIHYMAYDCSRLFVEDTDRPFFADRLFANRLVALAGTLQRSAQQNKIYIFEGPHGSGKSTFLNNLLKKFEEYANSPEGCRYEAVWRLDKEVLIRFDERETSLLINRLSQMLDKTASLQDDIIQAQKNAYESAHIVEVPCPSHDSPILIVPKELRRSFIDDLFANTKHKYEIFTEKEYEWVFRDQACTICTSLYEALLDKLGSPAEVLKMLHARPFRFNRRLGEGISVFSPGDAPAKESILTNPILQSRIDDILRDSNRVRYIYSRFARTNNGIYALMDIKSHNKDRFFELHNIISEGVHKVEDIEENVNSMFIALLNPEDRDNIENFQSFTDRTETIKIPYVLDLKTEVEIYRHHFGKHIEEAFLPRVLHNFARVIIASRLNPTSQAMLDWIEDPKKYALYCDENLLLLKMEIFTGHIPEWLTSEDRKRLTAKRRRKIIAESETEGFKGVSGRDSIRIFNDLFSTMSRKDQLIDMTTVVRFFSRTHPELKKQLPEGFMDSLLRMYDYTVLQEVRESLYYYNEEQISNDIQNYLFALNYDLGSKVTNRFNGQKVEVTEEFLSTIENRLLGAGASSEQRQAFRLETQKEYTARTLTQEIMVEGHPLTETELYRRLYERYVDSLKEKALDPFLENENFRRAIKDYEREEFRTYDRKIREDVSYLIQNLCERHNYSKKGAKEVCIYVIDNNLTGKFS